MSSPKGDPNKTYKWRTKRVWLSAIKADDIIGIAGADTGQNAGAPVVAIQSGSGTIGIVQVAADADEIQFLMLIPHDLRRESQVLGRVVFSHNSTDADEPVFNVKSTFYAKQATLVDFDTSDDQNATFAAHVCSTTTASLEATVWTDLKWDQSIEDTDMAVGIILICTTMSGSANEVELLGLELMYEVDAIGNRRGKTSDALLEQPL